MSWADQVELELREAEAAKKDAHTFSGNLNSPPSLAPAAPRLEVSFLPPGIVHVGGTSSNAEQQHHASQTPVVDSDPVHGTSFGIPSLHEQRVHEPEDSTDECMRMLRNIGINSTEEWPTKLHTTVKWSAKEAAISVKELFNCTVMCYFTDRSPLLSTFRDWVEDIFVHDMGWPVVQIKFAGKNFFMITFEKAEHRDATLALAPLFMDRKFVYTFPWDPAFDVRTESYTKLPVWIEIPFRALLLEKCRMMIAESFGHVLFYIQGDALSAYPHDRVCILWDTTREVPHSVKVDLENGILIWQLVMFKNIPYHCYKCNKKGHLARECKETEEETNNNPMINSNKTSTEASTKVKDSLTNDGGRRPATQDHSRPSSWGMVGTDLLFEMEEA